MLMRHCIKKLFKPLLSSVLLFNEQFHIQLALYCDFLLFLFFSPSLSWYRFHGTFHANMVEDLVILCHFDGSFHDLRWPQTFNCLFKRHNGNFEIRYTEWNEIVCVSVTFSYGRPVAYRTLNVLMRNQVWNELEWDLHVNFRYYNFANGSYIIYIYLSRESESINKN